MPLFKKRDKEVFFIHIPRSSGRYIISLFEKNGYEIFFWNYDEKIGGIEIPHLHYPHYNTYLNVEDKNHFTIVRNPYSKFCSAMNVIHHAHKIPVEEYYKLRDSEYLTSVLNNSRHNISYHNNWYRPQHEFVSEKTHVWKYEDGVESNFIEWLNDIFDLDLKNSDDIEYEFEGGEKREYIIGDDKEIEFNIREYYSKDYEIFKY